MTDYAKYGLVCHLLGIRSQEQLSFHLLRGAIFESWVISEIYKTIVHSGVQPNLYHYRETRGLEIDLLIEQDQGLDVVEINPHNPNVFLTESPV